MRRTERCPWCYEPVTVDDRRLDGGAEALAHIRKCPFIRRPAQDEAVQ